MVKFYNYYNQLFFSQCQQVKENYPPAVSPSVPRHPKRTSSSQAYPVIPGLTRDPQNLANTKGIAGQARNDEGDCYCTCRKIFIPCLFTKNHSLLRVHYTNYAHIFNLPRRRNHRYKGCEYRRGNRRRQHNDWRLPKITPVGRNHKPEKETVEKQS